MPALAIRTAKVFVHDNHPFGYGTPLGPNEPDTPQSGWATSHVTTATPGRHADATTAVMKEPSGTAVAMLKR